MTIHTLSNRDVATLDRRVVIKTQRKSKGGIKKQRGGHTGKIGIIYEQDGSGYEHEMDRFSAPSFKSLSKKMRSTGLIPTHVTLKNKGETSF